jgi:hypothetical protein
VSKVPEAVPLRARLGIHCVQVVICISFGKSLDLMFEDFATKRRLVWHIEWKASM